MNNLNHKVTVQIDFHGRRSKDVGFLAELELVQDFFKEGPFGPSQKLQRGRPRPQNTSRKRLKWPRCLGQMGKGSGLVCLPCLVQEVS